METCFKCGGLGWRIGYSHPDDVYFNTVCVDCAGMGKAPTEAPRIISHKYSFRHLKAVSEDLLDVVKKDQLVSIAESVPLGVVGYFKQEVNEEEQFVETTWHPISISWRKINAKLP